MTMMDDATRKMGGGEQMTEAFQQPAVIGRSRMMTCARRPIFLHRPMGIVSAEADPADVSNLVHVASTTFGPPNGTTDRTISWNKLL